MWVPACGVTCPPDAIANEQPLQTECWYWKIQQNPILHPLPTFLHVDCQHFSVAVIYLRKPVMTIDMGDGIQTLVLSVEVEYFTHPSDLITHVYFLLHTASCFCAALFRNFSPFSHNLLWSIPILLQFLSLLDPHCLGGADSRLLPLWHVMSPHASFSLARVRLPWEDATNLLMQWQEQDPSTSYGHGQLWA